MLELISAGVSHELVTPLKCILLVCNSLSKKMTEKAQIDQIRLVIDTTSLLLF